MLALAASIVVALYLLVPSSLFRLFFGLFVPLRNFERTRGEEILHGVLSTILPILIAVWLFRAIPRMQVPVEAGDYTIVFNGVYSEELFKQSGDLFWKSLDRTRESQERFLSLYYILMTVEGLLAGELAVSYPRFSGFGPYKWIAGHVLLPSITEWHLLLKPFFFVDKKNTTVRAEIFCSDGMLYRGNIAEHSVDKDGKLIGVLLLGAKRFRRDDYLNDKKASKLRPPTEYYWRDIPGSKFYLFADKILNLNITYEGPGPSKLMEAEISKKLNQPITVEVEKPPRKTSDAGTAPSQQAPGEAPGDA